MKTTEHLSLLQRIRTNLYSVKEVDDIGKQLLDNIIKFCEVDENLIYEDLLNQKNLELYLKEYQILISESKNIFVNRMLCFDKFSTNKLVSKLMRPYEFKWDIALKQLRTPSAKRDELDRRLDSWDILNDEDYDDKKKLNKELDSAKEEHNIFRQKLKIIDCEKDEAFKSYSYLFSFSFKTYVDKLNIIESNILRLSDSYTFSQDTFKDSDAIESAYAILVKMGFIKKVLPPDFYNQITLKNILTLQKNSSKDKYIAYAINKLKAFIVDSKKEIWEETLVKHFEIKDYDKKKTVKSSDIKTKEHKNIDLELERYFENLKS